MATFSLLGGVPMMESPEESQRANAALGMAQGNAAVNNFLRFRESALQQKRWEAGQSMRDAQFTGQLLSNEAQIIKNKLDTIGKLEGLEQMDRIGTAWSKTKEWESGGWGTEQKRDFYEYIEKNPSLATTPWYEQQVNNFNLAERHRRAKELLDEENRSRERVAGIRSAPDQPPRNPVFYNDPETGKRYFYSGNVWNEVGGKLSEIDAAELKARLEAVSDSVVLTPEKKTAAINAIVSEFRQRTDARKATAKQPLSENGVMDAMKKWAAGGDGDAKKVEPEKPKSKYRIEEVQ